MGFPGILTQSWSWNGLFDDHCGITSSSAKVIHHSQPLLGTGRSPTGSFVWDLDTQLSQVWYCGIQTCLYTNVRRDSALLED